MVPQLEGIENVQSLMDLMDKVDISTYEKPEDCTKHLKLLLKKGHLEAMMKATESFTFDAPTEQPSIDSQLLQIETYLARLKVLRQRLKVFNSFKTDSANH